MSDSSLTNTLVELQNNFTRLCEERREQELIDKVAFLNNLPEGNCIWLSNVVIPFPSGGSYIPPSRPETILKHAREYECIFVVDKARNKDTGEPLNLSASASIYHLKLDE